MYDNTTVFYVNDMVTALPPNPSNSRNKEKGNGT